jgi:hypothetical protein
MASVEGDTSRRDELLRKWNNYELSFEERDNLLVEIRRLGLFPQLMSINDEWESEAGLYPDLEDSKFVEKLMRKQEFAENKQDSIATQMEEGVNPCIDGLLAEKKGYKVLNEYTHPDSIDIIGLNGILHGLHPEDHTLRKECVRDLVRRIPDGTALLERLYAIPPRDFITRDPLARELLEKLLTVESLSAELKNIIESMLVYPFVMELPGTAGDNDDVNTRVMFLRDKVLVNSIERFIQADPTIKLVVILRGAYHAAYTRHFIKKSARLTLSDERGPRRDYLFVNYNAKARSRRAKKRNRRRNTHRRPKN